MAAEAIVDPAAWLAVFEDAFDRIAGCFGRREPRLAARDYLLGQLLVTAGDNPERLRSEAALAHLCGVAPIPASSGRKDRHRLNRGGDRAANNALYTIVLCRMRYDPRTRECVDRRTKQGLGKKEIMRCLKRYIVREVHAALLVDFKIMNSSKRS